MSRRQQTEIQGWQASWRIGGSFHTQPWSSPFSSRMPPPGDTASKDPFMLSSAPCTESTLGAFSMDIVFIFILSLVWPLLPEKDPRSPMSRLHLHIELGVAALACLGHDRHLLLLQVPFLRQQPRWHVFGLRPPRYLPRQPASAPPLRTPPQHTRSAKKANTRRSSTDRRQLESATRQQDQGRFRWMRWMRTR